MKIYQTMGLGLAILLSLSVTGCGVKQVAMSGQGESYRGRCDGAGSEDPRKAETDLGKFGIDRYDASGGRDCGSSGGSDGGGS